MSLESVDIATETAAHQEQAAVMVASVNIERGSGALSPQRGSRTGSSRGPVIEKVALAPSLRTRPPVVRAGEWP